MTVGHVIIIFPLQFFILESSKEKININWIYSTLTLGASHWETLRRVILPNIKKTIIVAFVFGFLLSFDEIVISNFVIDSTLVTVPKKIWNNIDRAINPEPIIPYLLVLVNLAFLGIFAIILDLTWYKIIRKMKDIKKIFKYKILKSVYISIGSFLFLLILSYAFKYIVDLEIPTLKITIYNLLFSITIFLIVSYFQVFKWSYVILDKILIFRNRFKKKFRQISIELISIEIEEAFSKVSSIFEGQTGKDLSVRETSRLTKILFDYSKGYYFGTDSNLPSEFIKVYPYYLRDSIKCDHSVRILINSESALTSDYFKNEKEFKKFIKWHNKNSSDLFFIEREGIDNIIKDFKLHSSDIGIWHNDYIMAFNPIFKSKVEINIRFWFLSEEMSEVNKEYVNYYIHLLSDFEPKNLKIASDGLLQFEDVEYNKKNYLIKQLEKLWKIS